MALHGALADEEAQPGPAALARARRVHGLKAAEDGLQLVRRNARP